MMRWIKIWILPGAVFQSVLVGGGYGTGREVVEFISRFGPVGGLSAIVLVGLLWGLVLAVTFEFARKFKTRDYRTFFKLILGRYWPAYELFFTAGLLIVLAVCGAAAGAVLKESFGLPALAGIALMLLIVGILNYYGRALVEKTLTVWGLAMSVVFIAFVVLTFFERSDRIMAAFGDAEFLPGWQVSGFQFFLYNIGIAPAILYATGHLDTRPQAIGAGLIAGLLGILPALAFHVAFMAGYPEVIDEPLPTYWMLQQLGIGWLLLVYVVILFGTIAQTGVGMLQGLNERLDAWWNERHGRALTRRTHSMIALGAVLGSLLLANVGIVGLVAKGYGTLAWFAFVIYVIPVLTIGVFMLRRRSTLTPHSPLHSGRTAEPTARAPLPPLDTPDYPRISDYVTHWASHAPDREALVLNGSRITYAELEELVARCVGTLVSLGVQPGDRVAMLSTPRPEFLVVFLATARIGGIWLGLNPKYTLDELRYVVGDAQPVVLITLAAIDGRTLREQAQALASEHPGIQHVITLELGREFAIRPLGPLLDYGSGQEPPAERYEAVTADSAALLVYTSGTTGRPKGALLPHRGLVHCSRIQRSHLRADPLRVLNNLPVNHVGCVGDLCAFVLVSGGTTVFAERFDSERIGPLIRDERITMWGQVPTMFQLTLDNPNFDPAMVSSVQEIAWSGAMAPEDLVRRLHALCPNLRSFYGMTETVGSVCYSDPDASLADLARTIGRPDPRYDVRIADPDGHVLPRGEAGEIQVRGDFLMRGYLNLREATRETFTADGWLRTGDSAVEEPDGQYRLIGRLREMFKSGGYNVYPREIEIVLESKPAIAMAAVVATPDPLYNEVGTAFIVWKAGEISDEAALREYCRGRLANYKIPKYFHVLDQMPMLPIGKVDRAELKRQASRLTGVS